MDNEVRRPRVLAVVAFLALVAGSARAHVPEGSIAPLVDRLKPAVVSVQATMAPSAVDRVAGRVLGPDGGEGGQGLGSGFIIDAGGLVATNAHVVEGASGVRVVLADGRSFRARVVGVDRDMDLALLRLDGAHDLPTIPLGDSDALRVGDPVVAIGNPFGLGSTVTAGIVSAKGRYLGAGPYDDFLQTDAPINPGNSGGPLVDHEGRVVGISTAMVANGQGIGFAIPVSSARAVLAQLRAHGRVTRGWIGVGIQDVTPSLGRLFAAPAGAGALLSEVDGGSPAARSGLRIGDVIVSFDGRKVDDAARLARYVAEARPGKQVQVGFLRGGHLQRRTVAVERLAAEGPPAGVPAATPARRGPRSLGAEVTSLARDDHGVVVTGVQPGSPAEQALTPGDVILDIDRRPVSSAKEVDTAVRRHARGPLLLRVERDDTVVFVTIDL